MSQKRLPEPGNLVHVTDGLLGVYLGLGIVIDVYGGEFTVLVGGMMDIYAMSELKLASERSHDGVQERPKKSRRPTTKSR